MGLATMPRIVSFTLLLIGLLGATLRAPVAQSEPLVLPAEQQRLLGIATAPITAATALATDGLVGEIQLPLAGTVAVASPYAGRVLQVAVDEGEMVVAGQLLATVGSRDYAEQRALLARRAAERDLARRQETRDAELLAAGVIPAARAEASRAARIVAAAELAGVEATLGDVTAAPGVPSAFQLIAPTAGRVMQRHIGAGDALAALSVAFVIAGDDRWRLEAGVPAALAQQIAAGARLRVGTIEVPISGRAPAIDRATQTVRVRALLPGASGFAPGQRVAVTLLLPVPAAALAVPRAALSRVAEQAHVFVLRDGAFHWVPVTVHGESGAESVVSGALAVGEPVVVTGVSALKAQLGD